MKFSEGRALLLRERLAPSRFSSVVEGPGEAIDRLSIGEYDREIEGENEETCRRIANSSVEFVSLTMLVRKVEDTVCGPPYVLMRFDN